MFGNSNACVLQVHESIPALIIAQFPFYPHDQTSRIYTPGTPEPAFPAKHTLVQFTVCLRVFAPPYERMDFTEIKVRQVSGRTGSGACSAGYAGLEFRHVAQQPLRDHQVVGVEVHRARLGYGKSELWHFSSFMNQNAAIIDRSRLVRKRQVPIKLRGVTFG